MKKWLILTAGLAAAACLSRLPHPARDVSRLEPAAVVWLHPEGKGLAIETDTGAKGVGETLTEAQADMKARASGEVFLDTAEFLILHPSVPVTEGFFSLLRPDCKVVCTAAAPDLEQAAAYLTIHPPRLTLSGIRAGINA